MGGTRRLAALIALAATSGGCRAPDGFRPDRLFLPTGAVPAVAPADPGQPAAAAAGVGRLRITVRWPDRDAPGFRAAVIPTSTSILVVTVRQGDLETGRAVLRREPGLATATADLAIKAASNLTVEVKAYRDSEDAVAIAVGSAAGVSVAPSRTTEVAVRLASLQAPEILGMSPNPARTGDTVTITGRNFLVVPGATPSVKIGSGVATVLAVGTDSLSVTVPAGAASGRVGLTVDGVPAASEATLWLAAGLTIAAPKAGWDPTASGTRAVIVGQSLQFSATPAWLLATGESSASLGTAPVVAWQVGAGTPGAIDAAGAFRAGQTPGQGQVYATLGSVSSETLSVKALDVAGFGITPSGGTLGPAGDASVRFAGINTFSDGSTGSAATFASSDPASVSVGVDGTAAVSDGRTYGTITITASSALKSGFAATASVTQTNYRVETIAGGTAGYQDGTGSAARFQYPAHLALDGTSGLFVADVGNSRLRRIDLATRAVTTPQASYSYIAAGYGVTLAGDQIFTTSGNRVLRAPRDLLLPQQTFAGSFQSGFVDATGQEARFTSPYGLAPDGLGNLYVAEYGNGTVRRIALGSGAVTTLAGDGTPGSQDGIGSAARLHYPVAVAPGGGSTLYVADYGENVFPGPKGGKIRKIDLTTGAVTTLAGSGLYASVDGIGAAAAFNTPDALAVDAAGIIYVAEQNGCRIRRVTPQGTVTTIAGSGVTTSIDGIGTGASFYQPWGIAVLPDGRTLYVADMATHKIRKLTRLP